MLKKIKQRVPRLLVQGQKYEEKGCKDTQPDDMIEDCNSSSTTGNFKSKPHQQVSKKCYIQSEWEGSLGENGYMFSYGWVHSLFTWNCYNMVDGLQNKIETKKCHIGTIAISDYQGLLLEHQDHTSHIWISPPAAMLEDQLRRKMTVWQGLSCCGGTDAPVHSNTNKLL